MPYWSRQARFMSIPPSLAPAAAGTDAGARAAGAPSTGTAKTPEPMIAPRTVE